MINATDLHSATSTCNLKQKQSVPHDLVIAPDEDSLASTTPTLGRVIGQYSVTRYIDTRDLTQAPSFLVTCLQRFIIFPKESFDFGKTPASYSDYVALLEAELRPVVSEGTQIRLIDYWPRTLNAAVSTDISETGTQENGVLRQHTSGSSTSTTNSFGVNLGVTGGVGAEGPTGSGTLGGNFEHSSTRSSSVEDTVGSSLSRSMQLTGAASMTIKDWASYATIVESESNGHPSLRWIWGQEYPWDLFQFRAANDAGDVELPKFMQDRLGDAVAGWVAPPSQLAMFGLDLVAHATWQVIPPDGAIMPPTMDFKLRGKVGRGSHSIGDVPAHGAQFPLVDGTTKGIRGSLATYEYRTTPVSPPSHPVLPDQSIKPLLDKPLDLELLALDPIDGVGADNGAALGFSPEMVCRRHVPTYGTFRAVSPANTLALRGRGFLPPAKDTPLKAELSSDGKASLEVFFKILDTDEEYSLIFKHWKSDDLGCMLTFDINGFVGITRLVDDREGEGGSNNVTAIALRSTDFTSTDYHDYLHLGLNRIKITITAAMATGADADDPAPPCGYVLRALAVG